MSDLSTIKFNYRQALKLAERLERVADVMEQQGSSRLVDVVAEFRGKWMGENADRYVRKCGKLQENVKKSGAEVRKAAAAIRRIAKNTYDAEMHNYEIAKKRTYS